MYTFEYDIGSGYVTCNPIFDKAQLVKGKGLEDRRVRYNITGDIQFYGDEYDSLKALLDLKYVSIPFRVYADSVLQVTGKLELVGKWDDLKKLVSFSFIQNDNYTSLLKNLEKKFTFETDRYALLNFLRANAIRSKLQAYEGVYTGDFKQFERHNEPTLHTGELDLSWSIGNSYEVAPLVDNEIYEYLRWGDGDEDTSSQFVEHGGQPFTCIQAHTAAASNEPGVGVDWDDYWKGNAELYISFQNYDYWPFSTRELVGGSYEYVDAVWVDSPSQYNQWGGEWQSASKPDGYGYVSAKFNAIKLFDLLEFVLNEIDSSIRIYENSTTYTGYCQYLEDNFSTKMNTYYTDFDKTKEISLSEIIEIFKTIFNCDWKLEDDIFIFVHASEVPDTDNLTGDYNLKDYEGNDYSSYQFEFDSKSKVNKEVFKIGTSNKPDFVDIEIAYDNDYEEIYETSSGIETDISFALGSGSACVFIASYSGNSLLDLELGRDTGMLSGELRYNELLSSSRVIYDHFQEGRPFSAYDSWTGGLTLSDFEQKRNTLILLTVPFTEVVNKDIETYVFSTTPFRVEIYEIVVSLNGAIAQLKGVI